MKNSGIFVVVILAAAFIISCGQSASKNDAENKTAPATDQQDSPGAASAVTPEPIAPEETTEPVTTTEKKPTNTGAPKTAPPTNKGSQAPSQTRGLDMDSDPDNSEILTHIDKYLLSSVQFSANPAGGFSNGIVTVTNTLSQASFQKIMLEVSILNEDGSLLRSDYYTVINIDADGGRKIVKLPESKTGKKISTHIIKVKSNELTNGEYVLTGN